MRVAGREEGDRWRGKCLRGVVDMHATGVRCWGREGCVDWSGSID